MAEMAAIKITVQLPIEIKERKKWVVASCPVLDVHSQGDTVKEAKKNLKEALDIFLTSCLERGTLDEVFKNCGISPVVERKGFHIPKENYMNIPLPMLVDSQKSCVCHA